MPAYCSDFAKTFNGLVFQFSEKIDEKQFCYQCTQCV